jgi:hypothetical protein
MAGIDGSYTSCASHRSPTDRMGDAANLLTQHPITAEQCGDTIDLSGFVRGKLALLSALALVAVPTAVVNCKTSVASGFKCPRQMRECSLSGAARWTDLIAFAIVARVLATFRGRAVA